MKMRLIFLLIFTALALLVACASSDVNELTTGTIQRIWDENDSRINGAIHRVEYGENVAYIFGTFHASREGWFPLADVVEDALRRSDIFLVEVEEIGLGGVYFRQTIMSARYLPDDMTWIEVLPENAYNHLVNTLATWNVAGAWNNIYESVNTVNPLFLILGLENELILEHSNAKANFENTVDAYIANVALELGLPIFGLESAEQQLDIMYNPPFEVMLTRIMNLLPREEFMEALNGTTDLDNILKFYENNDFDLMNYYIAIDLGADIECTYVTYFREVIMNWRSIYYTEEIIRLLRETEEPTVFFAAMGVTHVIRSGAGEEFTDVIEQLELAGFTMIN
ncbi:MAG: TraB/GumN family protein [Oscillospiraceae bacterium]|nr:TraB/GumN family protein [Oscillospiraceae bacterium]